MWIMTKSDWSVLVNLSRSAHIGYQQIARFDPCTRVIAAAWEQKFVLAECSDGDQAKATIGRIAPALAEGDPLLELRGIDLAELNGDATGGKTR